MQNWSVAAALRHFCGHGLRPDGPLRSTRQPGPAGTVWPAGPGPVRPAGPIRRQRLESVERLVRPAVERSQRRLRARTGSERRRRLLLWRAFPLRRVGAASLLRMGLVSAPRPGELASLFDRAMGPERLRLDLGLLRAVRLGDLSLRALDLGWACRLAVGPGHRLGSGLGLLAAGQRLYRLGAAAAGGRLRHAGRHPARWLQSQLRDRPAQLRLRRGAPLPRFPRRRLYPAGGAQHHDHPQHHEHHQLHRRQQPGDQRRRAGRACRTGDRPESPATPRRRRRPALAARVCSAT